MQTGQCNASNPVVMEWLTISYFGFSTGSINEVQRSCNLQASTNFLLGEQIKKSYIQMANQEQKVSWYNRITLLRSAIQLTRRFVIISCVQVKIVTDFLLSAPPGEFNEVLSGKSVNRAVLLRLLLANAIWNTNLHAFCALLNMCRRSSVSWKRSVCYGTYSAVSVNFRRE